MPRFAPALLLAAGLLTAAAPADDKKEDKEKAAVLAKLADEIVAAEKARKYAEMAELAEKAAKLDPKNPAFPFAAGTAHAALRRHDEAAKAFTAVIELAPKYAAAYDDRGNAYLKAGKFKEAAADFDKYLEFVPKAAPHHWQRGIALYYAGRFKDGADQFDLHRTVNKEDVENSAWHYLCTARAATPKEAREKLIPVTEDDRVPMKEVLQLYAGKLKPADVLAAAENAKLKGDDLTRARFYANLYVALFYESEGDAKKALEHLSAAAEKYKVGDYMWDVADAHLKLLKAKK